jgi:hypothetical protein
VGDIIKSLTRKDYTYMCGKDPLTPYCNSVVCRTRKYGIGGGTAASLPVLGALTKYDSRPPLYWWDVDGLRIELTVEEIMDFRKFKRACFERLNKVLPDLAGKKWDGLLRKALETLTVESVPEDASPEGQFWDLLEQFCNGRAQAYSRIELTGGKLQSTLYCKVMPPVSAIAGHGAVNILAHAPSTHPRYPHKRGPGGQAFPLRARGVSSPLVPKSGGERGPGR